MTSALHALRSRLVSSSILRNGSLVFLGNTINSGLSFVLLVLASRFFTTTQFGLFSLASGVLFLAAELSDMGINAGLIRFVAQYVREGDLEKARSVIAYTLRSRLMIALITLAAGLLVSHPLAVFFFHNASIAPLLNYSFLGVLPLVFLSWISATLQAYQRFELSVAISILNGIGKILAIGVAILLHHLIPSVAILCFSIGPALASLVGIFLIPHGSLSLSIQRREVVTELRSFSGWMALWAVLAIVHGKIDLLMLSSLSGAVAAGLFNAASQFATLFQLVSGALSTVLTPRLAGQGNKGLIAFLKYTPLAYAILTVTDLLILGGGDVLIPLLFGNRYDQALPLFRLLMIALLPFAYALIPVAVLNALSKPHIFALTAVVQIIITVPLDYIFIRHYGLLGVAYTSVIVNCCIMLISWWAVFRYLFHSNLSHANYLGQSTS